MKNFFSLFSAEVLLFCLFELFVNSFFFLLTFHSWSPFKRHYSAFLYAHYSELVFTRYIGVFSANFADDCVKII